MTFSSELLRSERAFEREWLLTNGIGGYASGTLGTANTRRYHGLLIAALHSPLGRAVLLSKLEETLCFADGAESLLSANFYPDTLYPTGNQLLTEWRGGNTAQWTWTTPNGGTFIKTVGMIPKANAAQIVYEYRPPIPPILGGTASLVSDFAEAVSPKFDADGQNESGSPQNWGDGGAFLSLVPLLAGKDYHSEKHETPDAPQCNWTAETATLTVIFPPIAGITTEPTALFLALTDETGEPMTDVTFEPSGVWYRRFQHPRERERGQDNEEDLYAPGTICIPLAADKKVVITASVGERKFSPLPAQSEPSADFADALKSAAQAFLIDVPNGGRQSIIAGYPWFSDWGRDTMIALPGLCLDTGNFVLAKSILLSYASFVSEGMIPNRFPDAGEIPDYNTVDATLWFFNAAYQTICQTDDWKLAERLYPILQNIIASHETGTRFNIHIDASDGLLSAGQPGVQLTWMDAKVGDYVVTPRIGKPVEINALWHNALQIMVWLAAKLKFFTEAQQFREKAARCAESFVTRFARPDGLGLYDVIDAEPDGGNDDAIRPNQIFAVSLPFAPIAADSELAKSVIEIVETELLTPVGLRTLASSDSRYIGHYGGSVWERDMAYHQGTAWAWLLGSFAEAYWKVCGDAVTARNFLEPLHAQMQTYGIGSLPEIADGDAPHRPNGCIAQAWSVGETLRVWELLTAEGARKNPSA